MRKAASAASILLLALCVSSLADGAAAMTFFPPAAVARNDQRLQPVPVGCRCDAAWAPRQYWQWDHRPVWDDPWRVLRPNFWGSPEPHLVPADIWACKWHLPQAHARHWHRRECPAWH
jgi:hypothetical protein